MDYDVGNIFCKKRSSFLFSMTALSIAFIGLMVIQSMSSEAYIKLFSSFTALIVIFLLNITLGTPGFIVGMSFNMFQILVYIYSYNTSPNTAYLYQLGIALVSLTVVLLFQIFTKRMAEKMNKLRLRIDEEQSRRIESETTVLNQQPNMQRTSLIVKHESIKDTPDISETLKMSKNASIDPLTTLPDRAKLIEHLDTLIEDRINYSQSHVSNDFTPGPITVIYLSATQNEKFNRNIGHRAIDLFIQSMAHRIRESADPQDMVGRITGTEFVIISRKTGTDNEMDAYIDSLCFAAEDALSNTDGHLISKVRAGYSVYPDDARFPGDLLGCAEIAMNEAFTTGLDKKRYHTDFRLDTAAGLDDMPLEKLSVMFDNAIANNEIYMVYQPVFTKDKVIKGFEAFVRWNNASFGIINNFEFIAAAERTGHIYKIGNLAMKMALTKLKEINKDYPELTMAINMSTIQLRNGNVCNDFMKLQEEIGFDIRNVILDIPEESLISNVQDIQSLLDSFSSTGVTITLDNFGRGYSSLNNIPLLPVSIVKLDGHFTSDLKEGSAARVLTNSIISLLNEIDVPVDATGVGTKEQFDSLVSFGCKLFQGKYLCDPMTEDKVKGFLRQTMS
ncbi:diguanylate cyclase (GGDEF) domain-containing protein [Ruminococcaceae bacterium KH2T8]|nr:diguanylate cyclase (GGDEF) domain-containing protein [Ruminococcaceae bacterium KH2T8]